MSTFYYRAQIKQPFPGKAGRKQTLNENRMLIVDLLVRRQPENKQFLQEAELFLVLSNLTQKYSGNTLSIMNCQTCPFSAKEAIICKMRVVYKFYEEIEINLTL